MDKNEDAALGHYETATSMKEMLRAGLATMRMRHYEDAALGHKLRQQASSAQGEKQMEREVRESSSCSNDMLRAGS